jgi:uncharacterized protein involved in type VI secretion and phage assembly
MPKLTDLLGRPHSGIVPTAVIGIVVENVDPDKLGRVRVKFPHLYVSGGSKMAESFWLRVLSPDAGSATGSVDGAGQQALGAGPALASGRGFYAVPEVEDEVLVLFTQGSQDVGIVIGQLYNGADGPPQEAGDTLPGTGHLWTGTRSKDGFTDGSGNLDNNDCRLWKSRSGAMLVFDDTPGAETIQIWNHSQTLALIFDSAENRIILCNNEGDIHIRTKTDLYLEAGQDIIWDAGRHLDGHAKEDITEVAGANYTFEAKMAGEMKFGTNLDIQAKANVTMKAGAMGTWEASANATFKAGAMGTFEAGGINTIKGGMVMIN